LDLKASRLWSIFVPENGYGGTVEISREWKTVFHGFQREKQKLFEHVDDECSIVAFVLRKSPICKKTVTNEGDVKQTFLGVIARQISISLHSSVIFVV